MWMCVCVHNMCTVACVCASVCVQLSYHGRLYKDVHIYKENLSLSLPLSSHTLSPLLFFLFTLNISLYE